MPQVSQYYNVLRQKLGPSIDIQRLGSQNIPLRGSTLFGPQIRTSNYQSFQHKLNPHIQDQLRKMNS